MSLKSKDGRFFWATRDEASCKSVYFNGSWNNLVALEDIRAYKSLHHTLMQKYTLDKVKLDNLKLHGDFFLQHHACFLPGPHMECVKDKINLDIH